MPPEMRSARDDLPQCLAQRARHAVCAGEHQEAGCILIQPVDQLGLVLEAEFQRALE